MIYFTDSFNIQLELKEIERKFKKIAIIGKYPVAIESSEINSQLIDLIKEIAVKSPELPQSFEINMDIEKKPNKQIKVNYISDRIISKFREINGVYGEDFTLEVLDRVYEILSSELGGEEQFTIFFKNITNESSPKKN